MMSSGDWYRGGDGCTIVYNHTASVLNSRLWYLHRHIAMYDSYYAYILTEVLSLCRETIFLDHLKRSKRMASKHHTASFSSITLTFRYMYDGAL